MEEICIRLSGRHHVSLLVSHVSVSARVCLADVKLSSRNDNADSPWIDGLLVDF